MAKAPAKTRSTKAPAAKKATVKSTPAATASSSTENTKAAATAAQDSEAAKARNNAVDTATAPQAPEPPERAPATVEGDAARESKEQTIRDHLAAQDRAGRPSPPDRDGDGKSGGSKKGNATDSKAKGTDQSVLARRDLEDDGLATIVIRAATVGNRGKVSVGVNGRIRNLASGVQVQVNAAELEALEASHVDYDVVTPAASAGTGASGAVEGSSASDAALPHDQGAAAPAADDTTNTREDLVAADEKVHAGQQPPASEAATQDAEGTTGNGEGASA